jgi:hypothetical protein
VVCLGGKTKQIKGERLAAFFCRLSDPAHKNG